MDAVSLAARPASASGPHQSGARVGRAALGGKYVVVAAVLAAFLTVLASVLQHDPAASPQAQRALIGPVIALAGLTGVVWALMVVFRNVAFIRGKVSERYFQTYTVDAPCEWVERPTRAYMNLLELPVLFYAVCLLMLVTQRFDAVQVSLAWLFVATRTAHALIYIAFNYVPLRFVSYLTGVITLGVLWTRFAAQTL
jgi:hypothetical protein